MMIEATKLIGLAVGAENTLSKVGTVRQIVVDPENGHVLGFLVSLGIMTPAKALSIMDVESWDPQGLVTKKESNLVDPEDIVRLKNVLDQKINLLGMPARTDTGKPLGRVEDFLIDVETETVIKYYLKDLLGQTRIMPAEKVVKIDKKIVFTDDSGEVRTTIVETQMA